MKQEFLVLYDYETGGAWAYLLADSEKQVGERYPELEVVHERPSWMSDEFAAGLRGRMTIDIDDDADPFLKALREGRARA
jgi:hypothetical protein